MPWASGQEEVVSWPCPPQREAKAHCSPIKIPTSYSKSRAPRSIPWSHRPTLKGGRVQGHVWMEKGGRRSGCAPVSDVNG